MSQETITTEAVTTTAEVTTQAVEVAAETIQTATETVGATTVASETLIGSSLVGIIPFIEYFALAVGLLIAFSALYLFVTPHKEIALIKEGNSAAAIAFSGALIGFSFPLVKAMEQSVSIPDFIIWSAIGCVAQLAAFFLSRAVFGDLKTKIEENKVGVGIGMAGIAIVFGMLNAASMSY